MWSFDRWKTHVCEWGIGNGNMILFISFNSKIQKIVKKFKFNQLVIMSKTGRENSIKTLWNMSINKFIQQSPKINILLNWYGLCFNSGMNKQNHQFVEFSQKHHSSHTWMYQTLRQVYKLMCIQNKFHFYKSVFYKSGIFKIYTKPLCTDIVYI